MRKLQIKQGTEGKFTDEKGVTSKKKDFNAHSMALEAKLTNYVTKNDVKDDDKDILASNNKGIYAPDSSGNHDYSAQERNGHCNYQKTAFM